MLQPHLPTLLEEEIGEVDYKNDFQFEFTIKNTEDLSHAFSLPFYNIEPGTITGAVNMPEKQTTINLAVPRLMFGAMMCDKLKWICFLRKQMV